MINEIREKVMRDLRFYEEQIKEADYKLEMLKSYLETLDEQEEQEKYQNTR